MDKNNNLILGVRGLEGQSKPVEIIKWIHLEEDQLEQLLML
jgi:hypothetical protein